MENISLDYVIRVHPVILYQIVDAYERRNEESHRVIGTLLGNVEKGIIEVTNSFSVLHKEYEDQVEADLGYAGELGELIKRVNRNENIVGWWATGNEVTNHSSVIHEYYSRECNNPIHLLLDTTLVNKKMALKGYVCAPLGVPGGKMGWMFTRIEVELICYTPEAIALNLCTKSIVSRNQQVVKPMSDLVQMAYANQKLSKMMENVVNYVDDVLAGRRKPNSAIGRSLLDLINSVPNMNHDQFSEMFNNNVKDLLMVTTLSQMLKTQLQLNEKLTLLTSM